MKSLKIISQSKYYTFIFYEDQKHTQHLISNIFDIYKHPSIYKRVTEDFERGTKLPLIQNITKYRLQKEK